MGSFNMDTPQKNTTQEIEITAVTAKGFGVGHINGFAVFVEDALPGDILKIHMVKAKTRYGFGKILEILTPSPHRIPSPCPIHSRCGGCQWQHADYNAQLQFKTQIVIDQLERIGGIKNPPVEPIMGMLKPVNYRNKAVFPIVPHNNENGFAIGMFAPRSHRIVEVENCLIQHPAHIDVLKVVKKYMRRNKLTPYNELTHQGLMRFVMIRTSLATKEVMVVLTINGQKLPHESGLVRDLEDIGVTTVVVSSHTSKSNVVLGDTFRTISGSGFITERLGHVKYQISAPSFFQVNPIQAKALYEVALRQANVKGKTVLDAHVGAGGVSLYAAKEAKDILGVDIVQPAITDGETNAKINGITNLAFACGAAEDVIPKLLQNPDNIPEVIFLDPPRKGCEPALLEAIIQANIPRIAYISCDPATFARDVKILAEGGYQLQTVQPVDMFPHTGKVEVSALLTK